MRVYCKGSRKVPTRHNHTAPLAFTIYTPKSCKPCTLVGAAARGVLLLLSGAAGGVPSPEQWSLGVCSGGLATTAIDWKSETVFFAALLLLSPCQDFVPHHYEIANRQARNDRHKKCILHRHDHQHQYVRTRHLKQTSRAHAPGSDQDVRVRVAPVAPVARVEPRARGLAASGCAGTNKIQAHRDKHIATGH